MIFTCNIVFALYDFSVIFERLGYLRNPRSLKEGMET